MLHALLRTSLAKIKDHKGWRLFRTKVTSAPTMHLQAHKNVFFSLIFILSLPETICQTEFDVSSGGCPSES